MQSNEPGIPLPGPAANDPGPARLVMPGRKVRAGAGVDWVGDGWRLFRKASLMWIVFLVLFTLIHLGMGMVPWVGMWIGNLVSPILLGGIALGCRSLETGGDLELEHLLAGFRRNTGLLFAIGVVYALGELALFGVFGLFAGPSFLSAILRGDEVAMASSLPDDPMQLALGALVTAALAIPLLAAYWFAPALAMLHGVPAIPAMKASLVACVRNAVPMLVNGLVMGALLVPAILPLGLGLVVWAPLMLATIYVSYRSIFTEADELAEDAP
ncbi:MAG TPA: BPSS1780 family membrane protein [Usitatibacteraceae bacterium]|nr:BPSS1780 family membrane protein [Usitatibacteraceae bacterium]